MLGDAIGVVCTLERATPADVRRTRRRRDRPPQRADPRRAGGRAREGEPGRLGASVAAQAPRGACGVTVGREHDPGPQSDASGTESPSLDSGRTRGADHLQPGPGPPAGPEVPPSRRAAGRPGAGGVGGPRQVGRPLRPLARRGLRRLRDQDDHRRAEAALPRQGMGRARQPQGAGALPRARTRHGAPSCSSSAATPPWRSWPRRPGRARRPSLRRSRPARGTAPRPSTPPRARTTRSRRGSASTTPTTTRWRTGRSSARPSPPCPQREQSILRMRFVDGLTQSEIAVAVGVSQMHVSRLLVLEPPEAPGGHRTGRVRARPERRNQARTGQVGV